MTTIPKTAQATYIGLIPDMGFKVAGITHKHCYIMERIKW